ncbi:MAG: transposase [Burkholderiales bacterium]|nr:transposase [Burkholderiales bacterium]
MCDIDKSQVAGLPAHAQIQQIRSAYYVFFAYCFSIRGKRKQERDYLGKVDLGNMAFVPNPYYGFKEPTFYERPLERWRDPEKKDRERRKIPPPSPVIEPIEEADSGHGIEPLAVDFSEDEKEIAVEKKKETSNFRTTNIEDGNSTSNIEEGNATAIENNKDSCNTSINGDCEPGDKKAYINISNPIHPVAQFQTVSLDADCEHNGEIANVCESNSCNITLENPTAGAAMPFCTNTRVEVTEFTPVYRYVGATAVCFALLEQTGMTADLGNYVFDGNAEDTMDAINMAVHTAVTSKPTYLAGPESTILQFMGDGCLKSPRASEFFQRIGSKEDVLMNLSRGRIARLGKGHLLALDGTCVDCGSRKISLSQVGKKKNGTFGPQINLSVLLDTDAGSVIGMRPYAGNIADIKTIDDYLPIWESFGVAEKDPILTFDRGFGSAATVVKLDTAGLRFIIALKTGMAQISSIIVANGQLFRSYRTLLGHHFCYGLKEPVTFTSDGVSADVDAFVYRNPNSEMTESMAFDEKLHRLEGAWEAGKADSKSKLLEYYFNPIPGQPLRRKEDLIEEKCKTFGCFALVSNVEGLSKDEALTKYSLRGEVETVFGLMFKHLAGSTRVHSTPALVGLLLTIFTGLDVLTTLRTRMKNWMPLPQPGSRKIPKQVRDLYSIASLLHQLNHIKLQRYGNGKIALIDVNQKDRELVAALGLPGLFDSAQKVHDLFTLKHLKEVIGKG